MGCGTRRRRTQQQTKSHLLFFCGGVDAKKEKRRKKKGRRWDGWLPNERRCACVGLGYNNGHTTWKRISDLEGSPPLSLYLIPNVTNPTTDSDVAFTTDQSARHLPTIPRPTVTSSLTEAPRWVVRPDHGVVSFRRHRDVNSPSNTESQFACGGSGIYYDGFYRFATDELDPPPNDVARFISMTSRGSSRRMAHIVCSPCLAASLTSPTTRAGTDI